MEIKCKKITCGFNDSTICMAEEITVGCTQGCKSYTKHSKKRKIEKIQKKNRFEASGELNEFKPSNVKHINCECSECLFNENRNCTSNGITLTCGEKTGLCVSHIKK